MKIMNLTGPWILFVRLLFFSWRVARRFTENKGLLLAGSVAYNSLLSVIPLFAVVMTLLSRFFDEATVRGVVMPQLEFIAPGYADNLTQEISAILAQRELVGGLGFLVLLFFSSLAFRILEDAISIIFHQQPGQQISVLQIQRVFKREFWLSAAIPFLYVATIGLALLLMTILISLVEAFSNQFFARIGLAGEHTVIWWFSIRLLNFLGQGLLFASIYKVMPTMHVGYKRALIGGFSAGLLWELSRRVLSWYFANISMASKIYGSFTTVVVILITMEVAAIIILVGAQVIAELEWSEEAGVPWYEGTKDAVSKAGRRLFGVEAVIMVDDSVE